nr:testis-expressed protein 12 [Pelodiscus sinensis]|eukprot:XP_006111332.2 testis-expressed protein 12 [Pelodiscus sinensis]
MFGGALCGAWGSLGTIHQALQAERLQGGNGVESLCGVLVTMTSNKIKSDENRSKRRKEMENEASESPQLSSLERPDLALSESSQSLYNPEALEKVLNDINKEINNLLSKYAHILSDRAAVDASYVQELDGILKEARIIENHLKQKRESLRNRFTVIANTLQS